jgi:GNAT superfamily N-acetyltransferase
VPADQTFLDGLTYTLLTPEVNLDRWECEPTIDWFLRQKALPYQQRRLTSVHCWLNGNDLAGYITTSMDRVTLYKSAQRDQVGVGDVCYTEGGRLKDAFPTLLIGMLGTCKRYQGKGLAKYMVKAAIGQARNLSDMIGCRFVTVDADLNDQVIKFYESLGFHKIDGQDPKRKTCWMYFDLKPRDQSP